MSSFFSDYEVSLDNVINHPIGHKNLNLKVKGLLKRLDHKPYELSIVVQSEKSIPNAVVRVYVGPKYNYEGQPIDINLHRHYFVELDQFPYDLVEGHNVIVRNSHQATGQSYDWLSVQQIKDNVDKAIRAQHPFYVPEPHQVHGFPARLVLPKGTPSGYPLQVLVVISAGVLQQHGSFGPVIPQQWQTYQSQHYQVVSDDEYQQYSRHPVDQVTGGIQAVEVIPDYEGSPIITEGNWHWGYLYKRYPGSYAYPHWQQWEQHQHQTNQQQQQQQELYGQQQGYGHIYGQTYQQKYGQQQVYGQQGVVGNQYVHHEQQQEPIIGQGPVVGVVGGVNRGLRNVGLGGVGSGVGVGVGGGVLGGVLGGIGGGVYQETQGQEYQGSGQYPTTGYHGGAATQGWKEQNQYLHQHYHNKHIGDIIGGAISLDGRPLGYPLDRPLAHSAFYAHNIFVKDAYVYHHEELVSEY